MAYSWAWRIAFGSPALIGPVVGVVSGIIIGLLAWIVGKFVKEPITASHEAVK